jgi:hypothetical protein
LKLPDVFCSLTKLAHPAAPSRHADNPQRNRDPSQHRPVILYLKRGTVTKKLDFMKILPDLNLTN